MAWCTIAGAPSGRAHSHIRLSLHPTLRRRSVAALVLAFLAVGAHAQSVADLHWDLSYQSALKAYPIGADEVLNDWLAQHPVRPSQARLAAYAGPPIEASFLLERPDSHAGDPQALWIIKTHSAAQACSFHPKLPDEQCTVLDPARAEAFLREVLAMKPDLALVSPEHVIDHEGPGGRARLMNYIAFISVAIDGKSLQRPVPMSELAPLAGPEDPAAGQLQTAINRLLLDDAQMALRDAEMRDEKRRMAAEHAAEVGDLLALRRLLGEAGGDPLELLPLLANAARHRQLAAVDLLLARGASIDGQQSCALRAAVEVGDIIMVTQLLARGAQADPPPSSIGSHEDLYESALGVAARNGNAEIARLLIAHGAKADLATSVPIVWLAARSHDLDTLDTVLQAGAAPDVLSSASGNTALIDVAEGSSGEAPGKGSTEQVMRRLIAAGADINFTTRICHTAYDQARTAVFKASAAPLPLLVSLGADPLRAADCNARAQRGGAAAASSSMRRRPWSWLGDAQSRRTTLPLLRRCSHR